MSTHKKSKDHADFQSKYRRSSNFGGAISEEDALKVAGEGEVKLEKDPDMISKEDKKKIADAMDHMQRKFENTDEREISREEE